MSLPMKREKRDEKFHGHFTVDIYDLGGISESKVNEEFIWIVKQYIKLIENVTSVDHMSIVQHVSNEHIDRSRTLKYSFVIVSAKAKHSLQRELFKQLRDIDTGCSANVELEDFT